MRAVAKDLEEVDDLITGENVVLTLEEITVALTEFASEPMYEDMIVAIGSGMIGRVFGDGGYISKQPELLKFWGLADNKNDIASEVGLSLFRDEATTMSFMNFLVERGLSRQAEEGEYVVGEDGDILMDIIVAQLPEPEEDDIGLCLMFGAENMDAVAMRVLNEFLR